MHGVGHVGGEVPCPARLVDLGDGQSDFGQVADVISIAGIDGQHDQVAVGHGQGLGQNVSLFAQVDGALGDRERLVRMPVFDPECDAITARRVCVGHAGRDPHLPSDWAFPRDGDELRRRRVHGDRVWRQAARDVLELIRRIAHQARKLDTLLLPATDLRLWVCGEFLVQ